MPFALKRRRNGTSVPSLQVVRIYIRHKTRGLTRGQNARTILISSQLVYTTQMLDETPSKETLESAWGCSLCSVVHMPSKETLDPAVKQIETNRCLNHMPCLGACNKKTMPSKKINQTNNSRKTWRETEANMMGLLQQMHTLRLPWNQRRTI